MTTKTVTIAEVTHYMYNRNIREVLFEDIQKQGVFYGIKLDLSNPNDEYEFSLLGNFTNVTIREEELKEKIVKLILSDKEPENDKQPKKILAIGHKRLDSFFILNGNGELQSEKKCRQRLKD